MRNPVNRLATAAPRAFDSILKPTSSTTTSSSSTTDSTNTENEKRSRGASFHMMDLSVLLTTDNTNDGSSITAPPESVGDETGSVLTFDAIQNSTSLDYCGWGWNDKGEVGL
eukprot:CAMPEP_0113412940 /NCGR_PEP_ID=MMETSP0013_2-20120614/23118_1 /TAXON_ID=2843 ORGANISM="Skeletonema costatum, Strain 1716" /NCGR_SAMPLE_ID=MMETSP0013_2 /ASSEMBLY_ACC=CAM_ASM_000158 /LENGTH=111 /DNA_ID=CAMNT_0000299497 /DNA_START=88 /DNA_END=423 /DNA_ORIENTATION=- /assembly_acc=CAM_ASM_000158